MKLYWVLKTFFYRLFFKKIGWNSYIGSIVFLLGGKYIIIANKVRIFPGLRMEVHNKGKIIIEEDISIGQNIHITSSDLELRIGKHTTILGNVFITNIDHNYQEIGKHVLKQSMLVKHTEIGENCFIGYGAAIQAGTILGKQCIVGANSVVRGIFPDYSVIVGAPAKVIKRYCFETATWRKVNSEGSFVD